MVFTAGFIDETDVIVDPEDDVFYDSNLDNEFEFTDKKPNVDITQVTYARSGRDNAITVTLTVKGVIEDVNDFDDTDMNNFTGRMVQYSILIEMKNTTYEIQYVDQNCTLNGDSTDDYTVSGSTFSITFDTIDQEDVYEACYGYTMEFEIFSLTRMALYMDIAPDEAFFIAIIDAPSFGWVGEEIQFQGSYEDFLTMSSAPYTYSWDFGDGSQAVFGAAVSHIFSVPGTYTIEFTVEDATGLTASDSLDIIIQHQDDLYPPQLKIVKPENGLYLFNRKMPGVSLDRTYVIGDIDIIVEAYDNESSVDRVEFYVDGGCRAVALDPPYAFRWDDQKISLFPQDYVLKIRCADFYENVVEKEIRIQCFF